MVAFERNRFGHLTFSLHVPRRRDELVRLRSRGIRVAENAAYLLAPRAYRSHRLKETSYRVSLMPASVIVKEKERTTEALESIAVAFGYEIPCAGLFPLLRTEIPDRVMWMLGLQYITGFHRPISDGAGSPHVFMLSLSVHEPVFIAYPYVRDDTYYWSEGGAFAFFVQPHV